MRLNIALLLFAALISADCLAAPEEIQVYMDEMNDPGKFGLDLHNNYVFSGSGLPQYPGGIPPVHIYRLTPEFSYGLTSSIELGAYFLTSYRSASGAAADGEKIRVKFIAPKDPGQSYFWGANLEVGRVDSGLEPNPWNAELKEIYGFRTGLWTVAFNGNLDWSLSGPYQPPLSFEVDTKISYGNRYKFGFESYNEVGFVQKPGPLSQFSQTVYAVIDTELLGWELNFGLGKGLNAHLSVDRKSHRRRANRLILSRPDCLMLAIDA